MGRWLFSSSVADPPGPVSVTLARRPSQPGCTGSMKTKLELPSPSATTGISKSREKSAAPSLEWPATRYWPPAFGRVGGASITKMGSRKGTRSALMPLNRRWDIADVLEACQHYITKTGRRVSFEWAAIAGENDSVEEAHRLGRLLSGMLCHVNIIPLNPTGGFDGRPARDNQIVEFRAALSQYGVSSSVRVRRGIDIEAGCGQLKTAVVQLADIDAG